MATPTLKSEIRDCVAQALEKARANGAGKTWDQSTHCVAIGYAAAETASAGEIDPIAFAKTYGEHGFLANCSQFAQVLDKLDVTDACYVKRPDSLRSKLSGWK